MIIFEDKEHDITIHKTPDYKQEQKYMVVYGLSSVIKKDKASAYKEALENIDHALRCEGIELEEL